MNAWSLLYDILNGTFDEEYPIVGKKETEHSDYYYDYTRNDPNAKNPFTDPKDRERAKNLLEDCNGLDYEVDLMTDQYAHHTQMQIHLTMMGGLNNIIKNNQKKSQEQITILSIMKMRYLKIFKSMSQEHIKDTIQEQNMSFVKCKPST